MNNKTTQSKYKLTAKDSGPFIVLLAFAALLTFSTCSQDKDHIPDYNDSISIDDVASKLHAQWFEETMAAQRQVTDTERLMQTRKDVSAAVLDILYENQNKTPYQCMQIYEDKYNPDKKDPYKTVVAQDLRVYSVSVSRDDFDYLLQAYPHYNPSLSSYLIYPNDQRYRNGLEYYFDGFYPQLKNEVRVDRHTLPKMYIQRMKSHEKD